MQFFPDFTSMYIMTESLAGGVQNVVFMHDQALVWPARPIPPLSFAMLRLHARGKGLANSC